MACSTLILCAGAHFSMKVRRRPVITAPGMMLLTCTPSLIPCSANALASAIIAALIAATAAKAGFGSRAALPDMNTTEPLDCFSVSQARIVSRRAPCSFNSAPARHCSSVISNRSIWGTAPAMFNSASILPKRSSVVLTSAWADSTLLKSRSQIRGSAPAVLTASATSFRAAAFRAASTIAEKSRANRIAVDRPMPWLAPVTMATEFTTSPYFRWVRASGFESRFGLRGHRPLRFQDDVYDALRRRQQWGVIYGERPSRSVHPGRHEVLGLGIDHAVFFRNQVPGRLGPPRWFCDRFLNTLQRDRPLYRRRQCELICRGMLRESVSEALLGHPDETVAVRSELR